MALQPTNRTGNIFPVHVDLRQRVCTTNLLRWSLEAPLIISDEAGELLRKNVCGFRPQMMLTLLSFCYASSYYGSEDIARAINTDRTWAGHVTTDAGMVSGERHVRGARPAPPRGLRESYLRRLREATYGVRTWRTGHP